MHKGRIPRLAQGHNLKPRMRMHKPVADLSRGFGSRKLGVDGGGNEDAAVKLR
jgi:hypothetical protein